MRGRFASIALAAMLGTTSTELAAQAPVSDELRLWSGSSALTIPAGRWELGLFGASRYGLDDSLELGLHPILIAALPHLEIKRMFARDARHVVAVRARVSHPTTLLEIVSKEGSLGLLPATSRPPFALLFEGDAVFSSEWFDAQLVSLWFGGAVAVHEPFTAMELPLLDFPFLYQRFAALYGPGVPRLGFAFEGFVAGGLYYATELVAYVMPGLPDVEHASAVEHGAELEYRLGRHVALSVGLRTSHAHYPVGRRTHFLPYADVRAGF